MCGSSGERGGISKGTFGLTDCAVLAQISNGRKAFAEGI